MTPVARALVKMPRPATTLQSNVNERYGRARKNAPSVTSFLCDMARSVEANHRSGCEQAGKNERGGGKGAHRSDPQGQNPVPSSRSTSAIVCSISRR